MGLKLNTSLVEFLTKFLDIENKKALLKQNLAPMVENGLCSKVNEYFMRTDQELRIKMTKDNILIIYREDEPGKILAELDPYQIKPAAEPRFSADMSYKPGGRQSKFRDLYSLLGMYVRL